MRITSGKSSPEALPSPAAGPSNSLLNKALEFGKSATNFTRDSALAFADVGGGALALVSRYAYPETYGKGRRLDGKTLFVIPGFTEGDFELAPLRRSLERKGATVVASGLSRNVGDGIANVDRVEKNFLDAWKSNGRQPIYVVGHSLGGLMSLELARRHPDKVRGVITQGTPMSLEAGRAAVVALARYPLLHNFEPLTEAPLKAAAAGVPIANIWSKNDLITHAELVVIPGSIAVESDDTHIGMVFGGSTLRAMDAAFDALDAKEAAASGTKPSGDAFEAD